MLAQHAEEAPAMNHAAETIAPSDGGKRLTAGLPPAQDWQRLAFWGALAAAALAGGVAITAGARVGAAGAVLLLALAGIGVVFLVWLSRGAGRRIGLFPESGAAEAASLALGARDTALIEALEEPALIADRAGGVLAANAAYRALAEAAGLLGESGRPAPVDRLFGADPALSAPCFRLAKAARAGERRREALPAALGAAGRGLVRYEGSVSPVAGGRVLWRLRPLEPDAAPLDPDADARRLFIDSAPVGFFAARADGGLVYLNQPLRSALQLHGGLEGLSLRDILAEDPQRLLRRERRGMPAARGALSLRGGDGGEIRAGALTYWPPGEGEGEAGPRGFLFLGEAFPDLAQPVKADRGEPAAAVFDLAPFGAAILDGVGATSARVLDANASLMELSGGAAAPGIAFAELFEASEGPANLAERLAAAAAGQQADLTLATNPPRRVRVRLARLPDGRGLAFVIDVATQLELEQRVAQSEKMREIGMLAGGVAHDFNNLLQVMVNHTHMLRLRHPLGDPDYHDLSIIHDQILRARELSEMLRAYARQQTFKVETLEVAAFVQQMHELARRLCGDAIRCEVRHGQNVPYVRADRGQLERVLVNLVSNARDAMTPKDSAIARDGVLTLRTMVANADAVRAYGAMPVDEREYVVIEVSDTGCGISEQDQSRIFLPFHSTKDPAKGTGLGLATSYGIVKQSGGYIFFDSKVGKGTTFRIFLPAHEPSEAELQELARRARETLNKPGQDMSGRGRILLVDDEQLVRESTAESLRQFGYEIVEAEDGVEGLSLLKADAAGFDLVISDVSMPNMNGFEMIQTAGRGSLGRARVLFMTAYSEIQVMPQEFEVSYLTKPQTPKALAQKIKEMLAS